jgi:rare lipoprotein A
MKAGTNRHGRQDHPARGHAGERRSRRPLRRTALAALCALAALGTVPAQAATGGASSVTVVAPGEGGIAFSSMHSADATWYGPGFYGHHTACGQTLRPATIGVAHRDLPCGTAVKFAYHGHYLVTRVIDRGPYSQGNDWDLTNGARRALDFEGSGRIRYAVEVHVARSGRSAE